MLFNIFGTFFVKIIADLLMKIMADTTRTQIVKLAAQQFKQYGIRSVSIDDLCRMLNMSKKTFYLYFRQKEDLIVAVLEMMDNCISAYMTEKLSGKSALECVRIFVDSMNELKDIQNQPPFIYDLRKYYPDIKNKHDAQINDIVREHISNHLKKGIAEGIYRDDLDIEACASYVTLVNQSWVYEAFNPQYITKERLLKFITNSLIRSIMTEKGLEEVRSRMKDEK